MNFTLPKPVSWGCLVRYAASGKSVGETRNVTNANRIHVRRSFALKT